MPAANLTAMRRFLSRAFDSHRAHHAAVAGDCRGYLSSLGFSGRVSSGGWIVRRQAPGGFGRSAAVLFPEIVSPGRPYPSGTEQSDPPCGLHGASVAFFESGIAGFYCAATIGKQNDPLSMQWQAVELGLPSEQPYQPLTAALAPLNLTARTKKYNFLRYHTDVTQIPDGAIPEEYSKEHLRVAFQTAYQAEISDVDGIFWGQQHTYPIEIKEKTAAPSPDMGPYFGLDVGPFVKLAFYAAKRGNLHSLYVVREIDNADERNLVQWWVITFDQLAQFASWVFRAGGQAMGGGQSAVVRTPRSEFQPLNAAALAAL
jgi:hypothetical protein